MADTFPPGRPQPVDGGTSRPSYMHGSTSSKQSSSTAAADARSARARACARRLASPHRTRTAPQPLAKVVHDLNKDPTLPFPDASYDVITNCVSVDYLNRPLEVFREMHRVLKPGGRAIMSFSNRCFPTKAIALWTATGDADHVWIVGSYFHYSVPGGFEPPTARDITARPRGPFSGAGDPMYVVTATKKAEA